MEARGHHEEAERPSSRGGRTSPQEDLTWLAFSLHSSPRASLTFFDHPLTVELGITNRNSLTHEEDYKNLTNGCELDSIHDDEDNAL